jgi:hypothetical protein
MKMVVLSIPAVDMFGIELFPARLRGVAVHIFPRESHFTLLGGGGMCGYTDMLARQSSSDLLVEHWEHSPESAYEWSCESATVYHGCKWGPCSCTVQDSLCGGKVDFTCDSLEMLAFARKTATIPKCEEDDWRTGKGWHVPALEYADQIDAEAVRQYTVVPIDECYFVTKENP